jgi:long-subunit fatty acid transport protein
LFWNRIENERQELKLTSKTPYIFNTRLSPEISFSIYKQDSTFTNTTFNSKIAYSINSKSHFGISYNAESSENLTKNNLENIETFSNFFFGLQFKYNRPKNDYFDHDKFFIEINPSVGKRKVDQEQSKQFKIEATASYLWDVNFRNSIYIRNKTFYLNSNSYLNNELSRIGGANSIRGFNEQSIFSKKFSYLNLEYRFLTSEKSYLYTITDIANISTPVGNENLLGIGLGYLFTTKNAQINLSSALGRSSSKGFDFDQTKLSINWTSFF